jgi:hypothetical protein
MLEQQQPFKSSFSILTMFGLYKYDTLSTNRRIFTIFFFILFHPVTLALQLLAVIYGEDVGESARAILFLSGTIILFAYDCAFLVYKDELNDFVADLSRIFCENQSAREEMMSVCATLKRNKIIKYSFFTIFITMAILMPFLSGSMGIPIYVPRACEDSTSCFFFVCTFHAFLLLYLGFASSITSEMFYDFIFVINAYILFFKTQIKTVNLNGSNGERNLIECIKFHRNTTRFALNLFLVPYVIFCVTEW